ncbi:MAG: HDIG domain-containing protein, partial [Peptococcaceae bacterium]|nr:HDIG domain-containing protein [Peptococcaceae bacterium]
VYNTMIERYFQESRTRMLAWLGMFVLIFLIILSAHFVPERTIWEVGSVSDQDIQSDRYLTFVDEEGTLRKQQQALEDFQDVYRIDLNKFNSITIAEISESFNALEEISVAQKDGELLKTVEKISMAHEVFDFNLEADEWTVLVNLEENRIRWLYNQGADYAITVMSNGIMQENLENAREKILQSIRNDRYITGAEEKFMLQVMQGVPLYATYVVDKEATEAKKAELLATVTPEKVVVQKGELVVGKGEVLTERQSLILQQLGYTKSTSPVLVVLGLAVLIAILVVLMRGFMIHFTPKIYQDERKIVLLMLLLAGTLFFYDLFLSLNISTVTERAAQVGYLLPVAMGTMLITILLDVRLGIIANIVLALFAGLYTENASFAVVALLGGLTGCLGVSALGQRSDISRTAFAIAVVNAVSIIGLGMIQSQTIDVILYGVGFGIFNGLISSIFTMGILPYLETIFGITTSIRLLELANPNQPLLKRLMTEAPGTYHHCIMVGNLGEAAADAIGANGLEVRLGAYYHDIGKLKRPYFFAENQFSGANPHDNITPQLSTLIITSHVKDGLEMAREEKLPPILMDMIAQHHGDSKVSYFYFKAKELDENAREQDFRYENPKPQTKEAAILMMADTVEAAVRSKKDATPGQIEGFIRTLIKGKLNDGQFDECELTFRDLDQIAVAFTRVINGIYHKRVEYPPQANLIAELKADEAKTPEAKAAQENMENSNSNVQELQEGQEEK